jgi:hypothetical protein
MPPNKPSSTVSQRRIFRGRGGPRDGNLPPKKTARVKVKYQHNPDGTSARADDDASDHADDVGINQLSLDVNNDDDESSTSKLNAGDNDDGDDIQNPLHKEIHHLQKRIENITLSIQASPLGISNPNTWRTNCLNPIKNVVKEWRSILSFHSASEIIEREGDDDGEHAELQKLMLHETSTKVFILLQMSMQSGPLVGSNPGYFKRCGSEVASIALDFLNDVIDLAGVEAPADDDDGGNSDELNADEDNNDGKEEAFLSPNSSNDGFSSDDSISSAADDDEVIATESVSETNLQSVNLTFEAATATTQTKELLIIQSLQHSFLFTEKQSTRLHQWRCSAQKAVESKKLPSKSASKLQGQKSKKQKQKELRIERTLKKKNKGGGRK